MRASSVLVTLVAAAAAVAVAAPAGAVPVLATDYSTWLTGAGGTASSTQILGPDSTNVSAISLTGGGSFTTDVLVQINTIGSTWGTWANDYGTATQYSGQVLWSLNDTSVGLTLTNLVALGMQIEPERFGSFDITLALDNGNSVTQSVNGDHGAAFFGYYGGGVVGLTISSADRFAFGNFVSVSSVPLPAALPLLVSAVGAFGAFSGWRRRRERAS